MPFDAVFDANAVQPQQGGGRHPPGNKFPFEISNTVVKPTKDGKGGMFEIEFTSPAGSIKNNYNLWNENETTRKIAQGELSALCHATGRFQIDFKNDGAALRGARGLMDVGFQKGQEPSAEKPEGGYVELKKVYDSQGNEPGKGAAQQQPQGQQQQPQGNQQGGTQNWGSGGQTQSNGSGGWSGGAGQQSQPQGSTGGWSQGDGQKTPPWKAS